MPPLWSRSFPDTLTIAQRYRASRQYADAAVEYEQAASLTRGTCFEREMLDDAWLCLVLHAWTAYQENWSVDAPRESGS
jgi:hypothetical protein